MLIIFIFVPFYEQQKRIKKFKLKIQTKNYY